MRDRAEAAERERDGWRDRYRDLQAEYARQSQAWSEKRADYEDRLARAEARQSVDPVEEKARELCAIAYPYEAWEMLAHRSQQEPLRRLAAHVLGQEGRHVDQ